MKTICSGVLTAGALALFLSAPLAGRAEEKPDKRLDVTSQKGRVVVHVAGKEYRLTPGPGDWDWMPALSPKGVYLAFLRQPQSTRNGMKLCLMRLNDGKVMVLRDRLFGVPRMPLQQMKLRWEGKDLLLSSGAQWSLFDMRGRKITASGQNKVSGKRIATNGVNFPQVASAIQGQLKKMGSNPAPPIPPRPQ